MRLYSNEKSVTHGEVSILAIAESLIAVALVFFLSVHFATLQWLAVAACSAPLLLLRTEASTEREARWMGFILEGKAGEKGEEWEYGPLIFLLITTYTLFTGQILLPIIVRFAATLFSVMVAPIPAIKAIPTNWSQVTLSMDSVYPVELIPGRVSFRLRRFLPGVLGAEPEFFARIASLSICLMFVPAYLYRCSLKATSIIYAPLVLVARTTFRQIGDLRVELARIARSDFTKIAAAYGFFVIATFVAKVAFMINVGDFADWWDTHPMSRFLALYIVPAEVPIWQLAAVANSLLALGVFLFTRAALIQIENGTPWSARSVEAALRATTFIRWTLTLYTIFCTGYITLYAAKDWHWPRLGTKLFPWL
jgi:hypothetical protein